MNEHKIKMITIYDKEYPEKLRNIYDPPVVLYIRGNENILNQKSIGMPLDLMSMRIFIQKTLNTSVLLSSNLWLLV